MDANAALQARIAEAKQRQEQGQVTKVAAASKAAQKILTPEELAENFGKIPDLLSVDIDEADHIIIYGDSGSGKTTLAGLLAEFYNILWFDGDKGLKALKNNLHPEMLKRIKPIRIPDNTANPLMVHTMLKVVTGRQCNICIAHGAVDCMHCKSNSDAAIVTVALNNLPKNWIVVMDSQTQFFYSTLALCYYKVTGKTGGDVDDFWRGVKDEMFAYWGAARNIVEKFGNYVKDLNCCFISISHTMMTEMEDKTKKLVPVGGSENASMNYAKYFGTEIHAKVLNMKHVYYSSTTASTSIQTKSRANVALEKEPIPSLLHVLRPQDAKELLVGSYNEWFFSKRDKPMPFPKEVLEP